jgi:CHAD domain-containing protein
MEQSTTAARLSLDAVARRLLRKRLRRLQREMRRCARGPGEPESVHQLRVATRRLDAVLRLFEPLYSPRRLKKARKQVRRLRQAARQVRDLDVLLEKLALSDDGAHDLSALTAELRLRRDDAMCELHRALRKRRRKRLRDQIARLRPVLDSRESLPGELPFESAGMLLRPCIAAFQSAAAADLSDTAALHRFRLHGKRLRYTLELLWGAKETGAAAELTRFLKDLQEQLGQINDHASASDILGAAADASTVAEVKLQARQLAEQELRCLDQGKADFLQWWTAQGVVQIRAALDRVLAGLTWAEVATGAPEVVERSAG